MGEMTSAEKRAAALMKILKEKIPTGVDLPSRYEERIAKAIADHANEVYNERARCLSGMARFAQEMGMPCGMGRHPDEEPWDEDWRFIVFIDLPTGQVSWHIHDSELHLFHFLPAYEGKWDGHTTREKYDRLDRFTRYDFKKADEERARKASGEV